MNDWIPVIVAVIGPGSLLGLFIRWWFKTRRDDRIADKLADMTEIRELRKQVFDMQQDRIQYEVTRRESSDQTMKVLGDMLALLKSMKGWPPS